MISIINKYLSQNKYSYLLTEFKDYFYSHPDYPSLYAITDTLKLLGIENIAIQLPKNQLEKLPNNFLAKISREDIDEFVLVEREENKIKYQTEKGKKQIVSSENFRNSWSGLVVAIEENRKEKEEKNSSPSGLILFGAVLVTIFLLSVLFIEISIVAFFFKIVLLTGLFISFLILQEKYADETEIISKICNLNSNTSCDSVIKSEIDISKHISFTDLPILFFSISFLAISLDFDYAPYIGLISLLTIPVVFYSIYIQAKKLKKWCVLCLAISSLLIIQTLYFIPNFSDFDTNLLSEFFTLSVVLSSIWFFTKSILEKQKDALKQNKGLLKFKRNFEVFMFLTEEPKEPEELANLGPIEIGNREVPVKLQLFLSPSCGHCHTAYEEALGLIEKHPDKIGLEIYYNLNNGNLDNPFVEIAQNLLQIAYFSNQPEEALYDWHIKKMDIEDWLKKWKQIEIDKRVEQNLKAQYNWCILNNWNFTPVKLINGHYLKHDYEIRELKYFLNDLIEEKKESIKQKVTIEI